MSRDLAEIKKIRREKANLEKLIKNYQRKNEELTEKEANLIKKIKTSQIGMTAWNTAENQQNEDGYILSDPIFDVLAKKPLWKTEIWKLREEVLQKQYENLKLEKELEAKKEEHRRFHELLALRKNSLSQCITGECPDLNGAEMRKEISSGESKRELTDSDRTVEDKREAMKIWHEISGKFNP